MPHQSRGPTNGWDGAECFREERPDIPLLYVSADKVDPERCAPGSVFGDRLPREHHPSYASVVALQVLMFRACEPMRMMHMFVCCHVYLEYHFEYFQIFRPGDHPPDGL